MPSPIAHLAVPSPQVLAAAGALVFVLIVLGVIIRRSRDPVGRSLAAHNVALSALRDSARRASGGPALTTMPTLASDPSSGPGVTIVEFRGAEPTARREDRAPTPSR